MATSDNENSSGWQNDVDDAQVMIVLSYGEAPLTNQEEVMVMQGWNKVLAHKSSFAEALLTKWRLLLSPDSMSKKPHKRWRAMGNVERNKDVLAWCLGPRLDDSEGLLIGLLDGVFRRYCPNEQTIHREAYRPIKDEVALSRKKGDVTLECESVEDYTRLFARCGIEPHYWIFFCQAFLWCMKTHFPSAREDDKEDLEKGPEGAYSKAIRDVALRAIDGIVRMHQQLEKDIFTKGIVNFWARHGETIKGGAFGELFFKSLLDQNTQLLDYFAQTDMDALAIHFTAILDVLAKSVQEFGTTGNFRETLDHLGKVHRHRNIPTYSYAIFGGHLLDALQKYFQREEQESKETDYPVTAKQLTQAYAVLFTELMSIIYYPMLQQEKKIDGAREFYKSIQTELNWTDEQLKGRMTEVEQDITITGSYIQTTEEIEIGARLAWRNCAKCIGRASWNTLKVRDCRHVTDPATIFHEIDEHLRAATAGMGIQSVMTVFKPLMPNETVGVRFWSPHLVSYAAYETTDGTVIGDPANLELTKYLINNDLWKPPKRKSPFDVLPLVLKVPGKTLPYVYQIPQEFIHEVNIEHPTISEIAQLGYKWTAVPALTNFKMNLGGVVYANIPFNGWFVSTEIVRNLYERYDIGSVVAKSIGLDIDTDPMWKQHVFVELERAVLHSFKKHGYTIEDPSSAGESFCAHIKREREKGRECPAQWSWIGGLTGPTNPTWHLEMRDFVLKPQYEYNMNGLSFYKRLGASPEVNCDDFKVSTAVSTVESAGSLTASRPKVLIAYGSETGHAEAVARRLGKELQCLNPTVLSLNEFGEQLEDVQEKKYSYLICICSTFGRGEPKNAESFFKKEIPPNAFVGVRSAVLGLGSTLYPDFCKAGIALDKKIAMSGTDRLIPLEKVDEAAGSVGAISDWIGLMRKLILPVHLEKELQISPESPVIHSFEWKKESSNGNKAVDDANALCVSNTELIIGSPDSESRKVHKITFELPDGVTYQTGDHLSVQPINSNTMVERFLKCFEFELSETARLRRNFPHPEHCLADLAARWLAIQPFDLVCVQEDVRTPSDVTFKTPTTLREVLKRHLDLSLSVKNAEVVLGVFKRELGVFIKELANRDKGAVNVLLKNNLFRDFAALSASILDESSEKKTGAIDTMVADFPTIVDFLQHFRDLFLDNFAAKTFKWKKRKPIIPLPEILVLLPKLQPRYYSITSSSQNSPREATITVSVLDTTTSRGKQVEGLCSNYLASLVEGKDRAKITVSPSEFHLPKNMMAPCVMVSAGTGISPLMGLLEDKALQWKSARDDVGPIHFFYGCKEKNFMYRDEIKKYENRNMVSLHLALSGKRPPTYVQDRIADKGKGVAKLLQRKDTHYYVCGDARMADECYEACIEALRMYGKMSRVQAVILVKTMQREGRWKTDNVWGIVSNYEDSKWEIEKKRRKRAELWLASVPSLAEIEEKERQEQEEKKEENGDEVDNEDEGEDDGTVEEEEQEKGKKKKKEQDKKEENNSKKHVKFEKD